MILRLILVGFVAALGLSIPQWSHPTNRDGSAQTAKITQVQDRTKQTFPRTGRTPHGDPRFPHSANATSSKKYQPVGFGSGVVRPYSKAAGNFWQIPTGPRGTAHGPTVTVVKPTPTPKRLEPIQLAVELNGGLADALNRDSQGLSIEKIQGPPARLKLLKPVYRPIEVAERLDGDLAMTLNRRAEGTEKIKMPIAKIQRRNEFRLVRSPLNGLDLFGTITKIVAEIPAPVPTVGTATEAKPSASVQTPIVPVLGRLVAANVDTLAVELNRRADLAGQTVGTVAEKIRGRLNTKPAPKSTDVIVANTPETAGLAPLPDDVFAPESPAQIVAKAAEAQPSVNLPTEVFAPEAPAPVVAKSVEAPQLASLPDDVFAPEPPSLKDLAAEEPAPEASSPPVMVSATKPVSDPPQAKPAMAQASTSVESKVTTPKTEPSPVKIKAETNDSPSRLTNAVSLTRDAAVAWMKLLSGPAVVTLTR